MDGQAESTDDKKAHAAGRAETASGHVRNDPGGAGDRRGSAGVNRTSPKKPNQGLEESDDADHADIDIYGAHPRDD